MVPISNDRAAWEGRRGIIRCRPQLLVSVRDQVEIADAMAGGADIIDLKEPLHGPLAPTAVELWRYAASWWKELASPGPPWLSAALGEHADAVRFASRLPPEFAFAKVGPSHCDSVDKLLEMWSQVRALLDDQIELVAVAYADFRNAQCIHPEAIFQAAIDAGLRRCLIDTYIKDGQSTLDHLGIDRLTRLGTMAGEGGIGWTLAGSIQASCLAQLLTHARLPDCFGVRGDVCDQGRAGTLSRDRVKLWKDSLATITHSGSGNKVRSPSQ